jgi:O-methyltransferase
MISGDLIASRDNDTLKGLVRKITRAAGVDIVRYRRPPAYELPVFPADVTPQVREILLRIDGYAATFVEGRIALVRAVRHLLRHEIEGCFVECGVWRGGCGMAMALTVLDEGRADRDLYLYDTFEGMTAPTAVDKSFDGVSAQEHLDRDASVRCIAGLDDVRRNLESTKYPQQRVHFIKGPVEQTLPGRAPAGPIALLRLDTDWYESTRHELVHLFPRLRQGGILIIDDYGHWQGARKAVDEYLLEAGKPYYLHRVDYTGRIVVKC